MNRPTQKQMYYAAVRRQGEQDELFMQMLNDPVAPITRAELKALIAKRPEQYSRYSGFLTKLT